MVDVIALIKQEGIEQGIEKGIERGRQEGRQKGERQQAITTADFTVYVPKIVRVTVPTFSRKAYSTHTEQDPVTETPIRHHTHPPQRYRGTVGV